MEIKFRNDYGSFVSESQKNVLDKYYVSYYDNNLLIKEESFYKGELMGLYVYNLNNQSHVNILTNYGTASYKWINIVEYQIYNGGFKLERTFGYDLDGTLDVTQLSLYDSNSELIAHSILDAAGNPKYENTRKYYFDRDVNPNDALFWCTYREDTGVLIELYWNNYHLDDTGQESFALLNTPDDIQQLISLTGMSQQLAEYYMSPNVIPNF